MTSSGTGNTQERASLHPTLMEVEPQAVTEELFSKRKMCGRPKQKYCVIEALFISLLVLCKIQKHQSAEASFYTQLCP